MLTLNQLRGPNTTTLWHEGCKNAHDLGFEGEKVGLWRTYKDSLKRGHIRLREENDSFAWE